MPASEFLSNLKNLYFQNQSKTLHPEEPNLQLVQQIIEQAKRIVAHPSKPQKIVFDSYLKNPFEEINIEETLEENPVIDLLEDFVIEKTEETDLHCVLMLDCSASMAGEKHLLSSLAVAVMLLQLKAQNCSVIHFSNQARVIKKMNTEQSSIETIRQFLKYKPKGFTNIGSGLEAGLKECSNKKRKMGLLVSDGRTTEGQDPLELAKKFDFLGVLHLEGPGSYLEASQEIARVGQGICFEVNEFEELPRRLYDSIRTLYQMVS